MERALRKLLPENAFGDVAPDRSRMMKANKGGDTKPEMMARSALHRLGYRFRLHCRDLPGNPDIVLPRFRTVIFVHGCFWHRHHCRDGRNVPNTHTDFWKAKFRRNLARDRKAHRELRETGWTVHVEWECQARDVELLEKRLKSLLASANVKQHPPPRNSTIGKGKRGHRRPVAGL